MFYLKYASATSRKQMESHDHEAVCVLQSPYRSTELYSTIVQLAVSMTAVLQTMFEGIVLRSESFHDHMTPIF